MKEFVWYDIIKDELMVLSDSDSKELSYQIMLRLIECDLDVDENGQIIVSIINLGEL